VESQLTHDVAAERDSSTAFVVESLTKEFETRTILCAAWDLTDDQGWRNDRGDRTLGIWEIDAASPAWEGSTNPAEVACCIVGSH
jgi:hypothetical protein